MKQLLKNIRNCEVCKAHLELGPRPVLSADVDSKIAIIGQAPGLKVHQSGVPWDDQSGMQLRKWLAISKEDFYNEKKIAIIPMGFCYPGKGASGDLPPRKECAPLWHAPLLAQMSNLKLVVLVGMYATRYYLENAKKNLTETVRSYEEYLPNYFVLPHPSPRNRFWLTKNPWFLSEVLPTLKERVHSLL
ncbi:uracil-DNA glycosylase family protein [Flavobacteriaceae bacterium F08102]|nr:uracil-DNA glycosylase family protein [Flavobacteriaceae bacterium F08102]